MREVLLTGGTVTWMEGPTGARHHLSDLMVTISDFSSGQRARVTASGTVHGRRIALEGSFGPLPSDILREEIPVDMSVRVSSRPALRIEGKISGLWSGPRFDLSIEVPPFPPKGLLRLLAQGRTIATADPEVLKSVAFEARVRGDLKETILERGVITLDRSTFALSARVRWPPTGQIHLDAVADRLDLDAYLPPPTRRDRPKGKGEEPRMGTAPDREERRGSSGVSGSGLGRRNSPASFWRNRRWYAVRPSAVSPSGRASCRQGTS